MEYYSLEPILSRGANLYFIIGERSRGKTYSFKEWAIKSWLKTRAQWVYVRRGDDEIRSIKDTLWNDIAYKYNLDVKSRGTVCLARMIKPAGLSKEESKEWDEENPWEIFGYYIPLSKQQNYKSGSYPLVDKICYDEFIIENTSRRYLNNEVDQLLSLIGTIERKRDKEKGQKRVVTVCFSNAAYISNPFFTAYKVEQRNFLNSVYVKRHDGKVIFELLKSGESNNLSVADVSTEAYKRYALHNDFKDGGNDLVIKKPKEARTWANITPNGLDWLTVYSSNRSLWVGDYTGDKDLRAYCTDSWQPVEDAPYSKSVIDSLKSLLNSRSIKFHSAEVRELFISWIR